MKERLTATTIPYIHPCSPLQASNSHSVRSCNIRNSKKSARATSWNAKFWLSWEWKCVNTCGSTRETAVRMPAKRSSITNGPISSVSQATNILAHLKCCSELEKDDISVEIQCILSKLQILSQEPDFDMNLSKKSQILSEQLHVQENSSKVLSKWNSHSTSGWISELSIVWIFWIGYQNSLVLYDQECSWPVSRCGIINSSFQPELKVV